MRSAVLLASLLLFSIAVAWLSSPERYVEVGNRETGETYSAEEVSEGAPVRLSWTHSIEHTPWVEVYEVVGDRLELREARVKSFGAGVDQVAPEVENRDGWVILSGTERTFPALHFFHSREVDRELSVGGRDVELGGIPQYAPVEVKVGQRPRVLLWLESL
ncbi:MAG: DUF1850 domain-containing protein [Rubrobacter sp.]|nr:DUF1850 domain-containing protein [Rubrobacter sp.]